ncbi:MAG: FlaA1/EpsC-like NDP-sugar epimerase [Polaribacter sp.]|jgi:FlaA1/EpsC-like NDP-sugar epimerase
MHLPNIAQFVKDKITNRQESFFAADIQANKNSLMNRIEGKSILVVGGAGTIGSSYIKAVLKFKPRRLIVVDTNENGLTELTRDLRSEAGQYIPADYVTYPMNFGSPVFRKFFINERPFDIVANFAAHKHVRSEKDRYSIEAMIDNNVFKAKAFLDLLLENPPNHFFCVSTDKAANPVNVMGASKKLMEETIMAYSKEVPISTARFANVAFSNGSLLDGYIQRLMKGQPISCPSDVRRFFVSPEESGEICMLACMLGHSGEIFFPKLAEEEMINFKDITLDFFESMQQEVHLCSSDTEARSYAANRKPTDPYPIYFFPTDTSGEKLYEEFYTDTDIVDTTTYEGMGVIKNAAKPPLAQVEETLAGLKTLMASDDYDKAAIVNQLKSVLPDFAHIETGKKLDDKM